MSVPGHESGWGGNTSFSLFQMDYTKDIIDILLRAPEGLSARKIVRHVYNAHNTLFESVDFESVKRDVIAELQRRSKSETSLIERGETRGVYRLNLKSQETQQLKLQFDFTDDNLPPETQTDVTMDLSLSLFGDF